MAHTGYYSESSSFDNVNQAVTQAGLYKDQAEAAALSAAGSVATVSASATAAAASAAASLISSQDSINASQNANTASQSAMSSQANASASAVAAAASAAAVGAQTLFSFKNRIINGATFVRQRNAVLTLTSNGTGYALDRWLSQNKGAGGTMIVGTASLPFNSLGLPALQATTSVAMTDSSGVNSWNPFNQAIEGINMADMIGQPFTVSFIFLTTLTGLYSVAVQDGPNATKSCVKTFTAVANVPQRVALTFPAIPFNVGSQFDSQAGLSLRIGALNTGTYNCPTAQVGTWQNQVYVCGQGSVNWCTVVNTQLTVTEIQFELGQTATPFERRPYPVELAMCQRYYNFGQARGDAYGTAGAGYSCRVYFPATMRATPTIGQSTSANLNWSTAVTTALVTTSGFSDYRVCTTTGAGSWTTNYTADAEL